MHTNDVHRRLLPAPLAADDEDFEDNDDLTRISYLLPMDPPQHRSIEYPRRFSHRKKSTVTVLPNLTCHLPEKYPNARQVRIRLVFIHIGEIDTLNEKYQADIYFEARWMEKCISLNKFNFSSQQQTQFNENSTVKMTELNSTIHWSPQLLIGNAVAQLGEQDRWFTMKKLDGESDPSSSPLFLNVEICEHRRMKGVFWEKLELNHFPADVQDLTVSITSHHQIENCILVQDNHFRSFINREAFVDQQEWSLYEHVATEERKTKEEYSFDDDHSGVEQKNHSVLAVTCRAARRPGYYYWNGFCLIFLITICSFCVFSISPNLPQSRLQTTCTLVLTSITFRWVVNRSLPQISYLTTLDIYAIISIIILVVLCIWHSIIASIIFFYSKLTEELEPNHMYVIIDRFVFIGLLSIYMVIHVALVIWLIFVPYRRRREMEHLDREYQAKKHIQLYTSPSQYGSKQELGFRRSSSVFEPLPPMKSMHNLTRKAMNMTEVREQDGNYYDEEKSNHVTYIEPS